MPPPSFSGTSSSVGFGIPGSNTTNFGAVDWTDIVSIDSGDFIYAVMTGNVTATGDNPECEGRDSGTYPPNGIFGSSAFIAGMRLWGGAGSQVRSGDSLWIAGRPNSTSATLQAERDGGGTVCSPGGAGLSLSSAQTIAYEIHPTGEVTQSPGMTTPGDTITYTATSYWTWENTRWLWQPNDTTATPKGTRWAYERCRDTMTCSHAPTKSGRMYFTGTIKGVSATVRAPISWVGTPADLPTPQVTLSCSPQTVVRGGNVTCTFNVGDTGPVDSISEVDWIFRPDSSRVYPQGPLSLWGSPVSHADSTDSPWSGRVVLAGTIRVRVDRVGKVDSATASVGVSPRQALPWSEVPSSLIQGTPFPYDAFGTDVSAGQSKWGFHTEADQAASHYSSELFEGEVSIDSIAAGPNKGYRWLTASALNSPWLVAYNEWLYPDGPEIIPLGTDSINNWDNVLLHAPQGSNGRTIDLFNDIKTHEEGGHQGKTANALRSYESCGNLTESWRRSRATHRS